jgi:hypothetical protein
LRQSAGQQQAGQHDRYGPLHLIASSWTER